MRVNKKVAATVSALAMTTGLLTMSAAAPAGAADGCNTNVVLGTAAAATGARGQFFELRFNGRGDNTCAWGRVTNGAIGMHVWVDRSSNGGRTWEPQLGLRRVDAGTSVHTEAWRDRNGQLMRACGDSGDGTAITCTAWW
ncbi:glycosyl hydrolase [Streptomyces lincolnensis]|uniref:glycosyl hydrolase n=1 Tax=Streptomyces lincolnensis TaxID=1915 RepID=UPI001E310100|nr:glycosyl hydrolase [Streptomyces lincolnensis]MCD7438575.1 glycosyl hydrolase [Streptomyces lincolnensis]